MIAMSGKNTYPLYLTLLMDIYTFGFNKITSNTLVQKKESSIAFLYFKLQLFITAKI